MFETLKLALNTEAQAVLAELRQLDPLFEGNLAYPDIKHRIRDSLVKERDRIRSEVLGGRSPKDVCLGAIALLSFRDLASGKYHLYRGILTLIGTQTLSVWRRAMDELVAIGVTSAEIHAARLEQLNTIIAASG